jgi:hypothetical protein
MKRTLLSLALAAIGFCSTTRACTHDVAFGFRMGAGFPGDVNRSGMFSVVPSLMDTTNGVRLYGDPVLINSAANSVRGFLAGDTAVTRIDGILVRPFPVQQSTGGMAASIGAATPPAGPAVVDVLRAGFGMVKCNNFAVNASQKGGAVYVWIAATSGNNVQGGFVAASSGSTITIANARWASPPDSTGIAEIEVWAA